MISQSKSKRLRLIGGILVGAATAGAVAAWALSQMSKQEFRPQENTFSAPQAEQRSQAITDEDGVASIKTDHYEVAGLTDPGKRRSNNQDNFRMGELALAGQEQTLVLVCDGMGGHAGGEVASQIASDLIWNVVSKQSGGDEQSLHQTMADSLERADAAIEQRASKERELEGMGTTAVMAALNPDSYIHCYLGDSRLYHIRGNEIIYQTKDHSVIRFLVEEGIVSPNEAKEHPLRSQLTSSLGGGPNANRLTIEPKWDASDSPLREWTSGDWLILCSDGLNSELDDDDIIGIVSDAGNAKSAALALRNQVLETAARDNVTIIVAQKF